MAARAMSRRKQCEDLVNSGLAPYREPAVASMRELLGRPLPPEVRVLWFEVSSDTWGLPVRVFGLDAEAINEVAVEDPPGSNAHRSVVSQRLVPGREPEYIPEDAIEEYDDDVPVGAYEFVARRIAGFVRDCDRAAGGERHPLPACAAHHDRGEALDRKADKWVDIEDIHSGGSLGSFDSP